MTNDLAPEQKQTIEFEILPLANKVLVVKNQEDRTLVVSDIRMAEELAKQIEEKFHPTENKVAAYRTYEKALDTEKQFYEPIKNFIQRAKATVKAFDVNEALRIQEDARKAEEAQRQKEREEQAKREAEARAAQEEADRQALEEFNRIQAEKKKNLELQQQAEAAGNAKVAGIAAKEVAKLDNEEQKVKVEYEQKVEDIQAKVQEPLPTPFFKPSANASKAKKIIYKARVSNALLACKSVAEGLIPFNAVEFKLSALNDLGKAHVEGQKIPGIKFVPDTNSRV